MVCALTVPLDVFTLIDRFGSGFVQNGEFDGFPFGNDTQNEGVGVILRDGVESKVDAVVGGFFDVLYDIRVVVLCPRFKVR